jgi:hypothetical protein
VQKVSIYIICFSLKYINNNTCLSSCNCDVFHWIYHLLLCELWSSLSFDAIQLFL